RHRVTEGRQEDSRRPRTVGPGRPRGTMNRLARFVAAALVLTTASVAAQSADTLSGKVLDASGASVADATVRVQIAGTVAGATRTDADGRFQVAVSADGARDVLVTAAGFAPSRPRVPAGGRTVEVTLEPAAFVE